MASVGKPLPWDLREAIVQQRLGGAKIRHIAAVLGISTRTVLKYSRGKCTTKPLERSEQSLECN